VSRNVSVPGTEVFLASPWVPAEWVRAHGLVPRGWYAAGHLEVTPLAAGVCAFAQSALRCAEVHPQGAFVFTTTCDQLRRAFDVRAGGGRERRFLFNVPATWQSGGSRVLFRAELERLGRFLETFGGLAPGPAHLAEVMRHYDLQRQLLREAADLWLSRRYADALAHFHWTGEACLPDLRESAASGAVPLALLGGPAVGQGERQPVAVIQAIEEAGGRVALDATEGGERSLWPRLPGGDWAHDPLTALAAAYLDHGADVFQRPNTRLYAWLRERFGPRGVRGIVLRTFVGCDLWRAEAQSLRETFGLPVLVLEAEEHSGGDAREAGRLQAFVEVLR
jgi:benzoyl-CoA reductase/2-hydroxyglutaryl-CoA dehydratase subunit BcrC/BadD/HgdB